MKRFLIVLLMSGCTTVGPDYDRPAVELPAQYPSTASTAQELLPPEWWKLFADPTLDELVAASRMSNVDVRLAAARG
jgi:outer membrane protein TolC